MTEFLLLITFSSISFGLGYYLGHRGLQGVKSDLDDAKSELEKARVKLNKPKAKINV